MADLTTLKKTIRTFGFDNDELRTLSTPGLPKRGADRGCERADTGLNQHMCGWVVTEFVDDFPRHHTIAVHHVNRNVTIAFVSGVRDDGPAVLCCLFCRVVHGVVVVALYANDLGAIKRNGGATSLADGGVNVNDATTAKQLCAPSDRAAVIAIGRTGHGHLGNDVGILAGKYFLRGGQVTFVLRSDVFLNQAKDCVGATERFKAF